MHAAGAAILAIFVALAVWLHFGAGVADHGIATQAAADDLADGELGRINATAEALRNK